MSSSSDDSETAEWEREQMMRGTQSRGRHQSSSSQTAKQSKAVSAESKFKSRIDANLAKSYIIDDIEKAEGEIETIKRNMGSTRIEMARSDNRIDAIRRQQKKLESFKVIAEELSNLRQPDEVTECLEKYRSLISELPTDCQELINTFETKNRESQVPMDIDNQYSRNGST